MYVAEGRFDDAEAMPDYQCPQPAAKRGAIFWLQWETIKGQEQPMRRSSRCSKVKTGFGRKPMSSPEILIPLRLRANPLGSTARQSTLDALEGADGGASMGKIKGLDGKPLPGARIIVREMKETTGFSTDYTGLPRHTVGDDGEFCLNLPAGRRYEVGTALGH
jgi:hypothetical protein